jgi:NAD(P)-dependent dehydrogenase (short-subunit alcohol dehydrogenase family)
VVVTDAHPERPISLAKKLESEFRVTIGMSVDVRKLDQIEAMTAAALECWGRIDVLHNNVGINKLAPIWEMDGETWDFAQDICLEAAVRTLRGTAGHGRAGAGSVINMASIAGYIGSTPPLTRRASTRRGSRCSTSARAPSRWPGWRPASAGAGWVRRSPTGWVGRRRCSRPRPATSMSSPVGGRVVLGLGNGTRRMMSDWHGVADESAPAVRMEELVTLLCRIWRLHEGAARAVSTG